MHIVYEILLDTGRILALLLVSFAFLISVMILFKPVWASTLNRKFNLMFNTNDSLNKLDHSVDTTDAFMRHRVLVGLMFLSGSLFVLWYTLGTFEIEKFIAYVIKPTTRRAEVTSQLVLQVLKWLFVIFSAVGSLAGAAILAKPEEFEKFSRKLDRLFSTKETIAALDNMHSRLDSWVLHHHVLVGGFLFIGSIFLMVLCVKSFFA